MAGTGPRTLQDRANGIRRQIRALARTGAEWDPDDLGLLTDLESEVKAARDQVIRALREHGHTDQAIAAALGVTQQAVSKRWPGGGRYVGAAGRYRQPKER